MNQIYTDIHSPDDDIFYQTGDSTSEAVDLEQVDQFQPEIEPRSTTSALTDLYASSQIEAHRYREQGDSDENDYFSDEQ